MPSQTGQTGPAKGPSRDVLEVGGLARERGAERRRVAQQDAADRLRQVEPLVRVDRERVDAVESLEERAPSRAAAAAGAP